jgi:hypothetical protein
MDHHVPQAITHGLQLRGVDVITAYQDSAHQLSDPALLERATDLGRVLFTQDDDLLVLASNWQKSGQQFTGLIYAHQLQVSIGSCVQQLEIITKAGDPSDLVNQIEFLR